MLTLTFSNQRSSFPHLVSTNNLNHEVSFVNGISVTSLFPAANPIYNLYTFTMVGDYVNIMKTTLDFNFDLHHAKHVNKEKLSIKKASL